MANNETIVTVDELQEQITALLKENTALKAALDELKAPPKVAIVDAKKGLNLRSGPSKSYEVLTVLPSNTTVEILPLPENAEVPGWLLITAGNYIGWAMAEFLKAVE